MPRSVCSHTRARGHADASDSLSLLLLLTGWTQQQVRHVVHEWQSRGFYSVQQIQDAGGERYALTSSSTTHTPAHVMPLLDCILSLRVCIYDCVGSACVAAVVLMCFACVLCSARSPRCNRLASRDWLVMLGRATARRDDAESVERQARVAALNHQEAERAQGPGARGSRRRSSNATVDFGRRTPRAAASAVVARLAAAHCANCIDWTCVASRTAAATTNGRGLPAPSFRPRLVRERRPQAQCDRCAAATAGGGGCDWRTEPPRARQCRVARRPQCEEAARIALGTAKAAGDDCWWQ